MGLSEIHTGTGLLSFFFSNLEMFKKLKYRKGK